MQVHVYTYIIYVYIHNQFTHARMHAHKHTHLNTKDLGLCKVLQEKLKFLNFVTSFHGV